ncbi:MAG: PepSY-like domain-containing protein [Bacteroidetes bacterium]|nr:PepSY-like domain-containing protein [Bacteroidota bacterium]
MKKIIFILMLAVASITVSAQKSNIPAACKTKLTQLYPNATGVKWGVEGNNYEAEFKNAGVETSLLLDASGNVQETEVGIDKSQLPAAVTLYMSKNVPTKKITEASRITDSAGKVTYEAEAGGLDYIFDETGNFIKTEKE